MSLILDSGALIAIDRNDRAMWRRLKSALESGDVPVTHGGIVGQAWRAQGPRSALLSLVLAGAEVRSIDEELGKAAGELLARTRRNDVIDSALVLLASDGDIIATSDPKDLLSLARNIGRAVDILEV